MSAGRKSHSDKKDWNTPPKYIIPIKEFFGGNIELDPCSNEYSRVNAETEFVYPDKDGLVEDWNYSTIFVNPPYGRNNGTSIKDWLIKGMTTNSSYDSELIYLIPVATNTAHFKDIVFQCFTDICFLNDTRLRFYDKGEENKKGAPMACCLVYMGNRREEFFNKFSKYGKVMQLD